MIMIKPYKTVLLISLLFGAMPIGFSAEAPDAQMLFKKRCVLCHAIDSNKKKLGQPVNAMSREAEVLREITTKGKNKMPGYERKLTSVEIDALVSYILANQKGS